MRGYLVIVILVCIYSFDSLGQEQNEITASQMGVRLGANLSSVHNASEDFNLKFGYHFGFYSNFALSSNWVLQPEIIYSSQGAKSDNGKLAYRYVSFPLKLRYIDPHYSLSIGPQLSALVDAIEKPKDGEDSRGGLKGFDFGLLLGIGLPITSRIACHVNYNLGFINISSRSRVNGSSYNRVLQFSLSHSINK